MSCRSPRPSRPTVYIAVATLSAVAFLGQALGGPTPLASTAVAGWPLAATVPH